MCLFKPIAPSVVSVFNSNDHYTLLLLKLVQIDTDEHISSILLFICRMTIKATWGANYNIHFSLTFSDVQIVISVTFVGLFFFNKQTQICACLSILKE